MKRGSGSVKARAVSKKSLSARRARVADPVHVDTIVPGWPENSLFPVGRTTIVTKCVPS